MTEPHAISPHGHAPNSRSNTPRSSLVRCERADLPTDTVGLARAMIGAFLIREPRDRTEERCVVRIVETEAYLVGDAGSHTFNGRTARNAAMFLARGHAYVYFIYGNHHCLNVVAETEDVGTGVLLRAAEPVSGLATLRARSGPRVAERDLLRGPGRLARALAVDRTLDGVDMCASGPLWLAKRAATTPEPDIGTSVRIGLTKNAAAELRFFERGNSLVSGPKGLAAN